MFVEIILVVVLAVLAIIIYILFKQQRKQQVLIESILSTAWKDLGLDEKVGQIKEFATGIKTDYEKLESSLQGQVGTISQLAKDVRDDYKSLDQILRQPQKRGSLGETFLEDILADQLPPGYYTIRTRTPYGQIPDGQIKSVSGTICVDSKFPLDNYRAYMDSEDENAKEDYKKKFLQNVDGHLKKIKNDYIKPEHGTTDFAIAFIPSESVYWFLVEVWFDKMMEWTREGVQIVSPLTMSQKVALIKAGVHAKKLSENAKYVVDKLKVLGDKFEQIDEEWRKFHGHLKNAGNKAEDLKSAYTGLKDEFQNIKNIDDENTN
ncbi:MAG: DNA recombination protein RmuC [Candidatus Hodarchaeota archaeon]